MKRCMFLGMFLAPLALLLIGAAAAATADTAALGSRPLQTPIVSRQRQSTDWGTPIWRQVRIEQHFSIRITPGIALMPRAMVEELEEQERIDRIEARKGGKCLGIASIAGLQPGDGDELLLFLRDQRIVSVRLEKRCSARDFYSGFYVMRNADGAICAGRDILQSRSGANCKVRRMNELVPSGYRRIP